MLESLPLALFFRGTSACVRKRFRHLVSTAVESRVPQKQSQKVVFQPSRRQADPQGGGDLIGRENQPDRHEAVAKD